MRMERGVFLGFGLVIISVLFMEYSSADEAEAEKIKYRCHTCNSGDPAEPNLNCLGNETVVSQTTWKANCTEKCFIRTNILFPGTTFRGCTELFPQLPKPMAEDGCYRFYLDTWCICGTELCNSGPLGKPQEKELDEHLWDSTGETPADDFAISTRSQFSVGHLIACVVFIHS